MPGQAETRRCSSRAPRDILSCSAVSKVRAPWGGLCLESLVSFSDSSPLELGTHPSAWISLACPPGTVD
jgi:hypothetical protein